MSDGKAEKPEEKYERKIIFKGERLQALRDIVSTRQNGQPIPNFQKAVDYALDIFIAASGAQPIARRKSKRRSLPLMEGGVSCGSPDALVAYLESDAATPYEITDTAVLDYLDNEGFEHPYVATANGWSMQDQSYPGSIAEGDQLVFVPIHEWREDIRAGRAVLSYMRLKNGDEGMSLKEHVGRIVRAGNPNFKGLDFGFGGDVADCHPIAICVWRLGRRLV